MRRKRAAEKRHRKTAEGDIAQPNNRPFGEGIAGKIDRAPGKTAKIMPNEQRMARCGRGNVEQTLPNAFAENDKNTIKKTKSGIFLNGMSAC